MYRGNKVEKLSRRFKKRLNTTYQSLPLAAVPKLTKCGKDWPEPLRIKERWRPRIDARRGNLGRGCWTSKSNDTLPVKGGFLRARKTHKDTDNFLVTVY
jgi:hypothetical protein